MALMVEDGRQLWNLHSWARMFNTWLLRQQVERNCIISNQKRRMKWLWSRSASQLEHPSETRLSPQRARRGHSEAAAETPRQRVMRAARAAIEWQRLKRLLLPTVASDAVNEICKESQSSKATKGVDHVGVFLKTSGAATAHHAVTATTRLLREQGFGDQIIAPARSEITYEKFVGGDEAKTTAGRGGLAGRGKGRGTSSPRFLPKPPGKGKGAKGKGKGGKGSPKTWIPKSSPQAGTK